MSATFHPYQVRKCTISKIARHVVRRARRAVKEWRRGSVGAPPRNRKFAR